MDEKELENLSELELEELKSITKFCLEVKEICEKAALDYITELNKLIGTNISEDTQNRATFYLGQSLYMIGKFEDAIKTFVIVQTVYPNLSKKWIDSALDKI